LKGFIEALLLPTPSHSTLHTTLLFSLLFGAQLLYSTLTVPAILPLSSVAPGSLSRYWSGIAPNKSSTYVQYAQERP